MGTHSKTQAIVETQAIVCATLAQRIDVLARELPHLSVSRIVFAVDDIRREARGARMDAVAALATGLERAMATSKGTAVILPYLDAMSDALACKTSVPGRQEALLASVSIRLHG